MAEYRVQYVPDEVIDSRDFVLLDRHDDGVHLFLRHGVRYLPDEENQVVLEAAWAAFREMAHVDIPRQWNGRGNTLSLGLDRRATGER